eukprot:TRINITY_DN33665_c0_g1_i1.p1 TRINITY_DN33665_c0_g1~~TRINITY_DN33665_c0_g1_i1.p1  ORF type:complete len:363 (+),score=86.87 TRINITY_DN33665_c0_g1_i1:45-1133(+)
MLRSGSHRSSSPPRSEPLRPVSMSPEFHYRTGGIGILPSPGSPYQVLHDAISSHGRRVSPPRATYVKAPVPVSPPVSPPVELPTPKQEPAPVAPEPEPKPEPVPTISITTGIKADLEKRLKEINALLKASRDAIREEVDKMETLEMEKEGIERQLLSMVSGNSTSNNNMELEDLKKALEASQNEVATMKGREQDFDGMMNDLRKQLEEVTNALLEERQKKPAVVKDVPKSDEHPVVGLELSEGAPYNIDGVWVVSVGASGPAASAGIEKGDIITEVSGIPIRTREVFRKVISSIENPNKAGQPYALPFRITREVNGVPVPKTINVSIAWAKKKPDGRRTITVQLSPRLGGRSRSPSPPKIKK